MKGTLSRIKWDFKSNMLILLLISLTIIISPSAYSCNDTCSCSDDGRASGECRKHSKGIFGENLCDRAKCECKQKEGGWSHECVR